MRLSNKITFSMARWTKGRASRPPGIGVHGALAEGIERGLSPSRVRQDARALKGLKAGRRSQARKLTSCLSLVVVMVSTWLMAMGGSASAADEGRPFGIKRFAMQTIEGVEER
jgi:hypothetical protein